MTVCLCVCMLAMWFLLQGTAPSPVALSEKHAQSGVLWSDTAEKLSVLDMQKEPIVDEFNYSGEGVHVSPPNNANFVPIGPPSRSVKLLCSFSSSTPPYAHHGSPQVSDMQTPPVSKRPLLGLSPHGLLPPPAIKGE